jgi:hypothetical protein
MITNLHWSSCTVLVILSDFNDGRTDPQTEEQRDRRTDSHDEINSRFGNFAKEPKNPV